MKGYITVPLIGFLALLLLVVLAIAAGAAPAPAFPLGDKMALIEPLITDFVPMQAPCGVPEQPGLKIKLTVNGTDYLLYIYTSTPMTFLLIEQQDGRGVYVWYGLLGGEWGPDATFEVAGSLTRAAFEQKWQQPCDYLKGAV